MLRVLAASLDEAANMLQRSRERAMKRVLISLTLSMAFSVVAAAQEPGDVAARISAARTLAGTEWASAANFFCSTEEQRPISGSSV